MRRLSNPSFTFFAAGQECPATRRLESLRYGSRLKPSLVVRFVVDTPTATRFVGGIQEELLVVDACDVTVTEGGDTCKVERANSKARPTLGATIAFERSLS